MSPPTSPSTVSSSSRITRTAPQPAPPPPASPSPVSPSPASLDPLLQARLEFTSFAERDLAPAGLGAVSLSPAERNPLSARTSLVELRAKLSLLVHERKRKGFSDGHLAQKIFLKGRAKDIQRDSMSWS